MIKGFNAEGKIVRATNWYEGEVKPIQAGEGLTKTMAPRTSSSTEELPLPQVVVDRNALYANFVDTVNKIAEQIVTSEEALRCLRLMETLFHSDERTPCSHLKAEKCVRKSRETLHATFPGFSILN